MADHEHKPADAHAAGGDAHGEHKKHKKHHHGAHPEHEHEEGWIVSFADNVLLMMGFFVILLAMNMGPKGTSDAAAAPSQSQSQNNILDVAIAVRQAFHNPVRLDSTKAEDQPLIRRMRQRAQEGRVPPRGPDGKDDEHQAVRPTEWSGQGAFVQFGEGLTTLDENSKNTIKQTAERLAGTKWIIEIRGHSSRWESASDVKQAHDLAYARAWAVGSELASQGVSWSQIRLVSAGDATPVIPRARSTDQATMNQRTEILILDETIPADPFSEPVGEFRETP
jgi:flagellar motor protein MotB